MRLGGQLLYWVLWVLALHATFAAEGELSCTSVIREHDALSPLFNHSHARTQTRKSSEQKVP